MWNREKGTIDRVKDRQDSKKQFLDTRNRDRCHAPNVFGTVDMEKVSQ